jgi:hypothetical protein
MGRLFPFCSLPKAGSRLAALRELAAVLQGGNSILRSGGPGMLRCYRSCLRGTGKTVIGVLQIAQVAFTLAATGVT